MHLVGFITKKIVTMHGHMNVKFFISCLVSGKHDLKYIHMVVEITRYIVFNLCILYLHFKHQLNCNNHKPSTLSSGVDESNYLV